LDTQPSHVGFLRHRRFRDLKLASLLCIVSLVAYWIHDPLDGPNGGTWLGYTLGTIGALLILMLTWLGIRKRRYGRGVGTVKGWLSAHVYFGLALVTIATLHTGFQFGWNVHTLSYLLMIAVIASGAIGTLVYSVLPTRITENRLGQSDEQMLAEIQELNRQSLTVADGLSPEVHDAIVRSVERVRIGGGVVAQLFGPREAKRREFQVLNDTLRARVNSLSSTPRRLQAQSTVKFMAEQIVDGGDQRSEQEIRQIRKLLDLLARRAELVSRVNRDIILHARLKVWLYAHVPLTLALLAALLTHIVTVFLYR
jgi:hypothetical protein